MNAVHADNEYTHFFCVFLCEEEKRSRRYIRKCVQIFFILILRGLLCKKKRIETLELLLLLFSVDEACTKYVSRENVRHTINENSLRLCAYKNAVIFVTIYFVLLLFSSFSFLVYLVFFFLYTFYILFNGTAMDMTFHLSKY